MESAQRELLGVLLDQLLSLGLISKSTYSGAMDSINSVISLPDFFQRPLCLSKEESGYEHTTGTP